MPTGGAVPPAPPPCARSAVCGLGRLRPRRPPPTTAAPPRRTGGRTSTFVITGAPASRQAAEMLPMRTRMGRAPASPSALISDANRLCCFKRRAINQRYFPPRLHKTGRTSFQTKGAFKNDASASSPRGPRAQGTGRSSSCRRSSFVVVFCHLGRWCLRLFYSVRLYLSDLANNRK